MDPLSLALIFAVAGALLYFFVLARRAGNRTSMVCTRCDGSGEVHERWPDPSAPGGWHQVDGVCPKCKGKGRV